MARHEQKPHNMEPWEHDVFYFMGKDTKLIDSLDALGKPDPKPRPQTKKSRFLETSPFAKDQEINALLDGFQTKPEEDPYDPYHFDCEATHVPAKSERKIRYLHKAMEHLIDGRPLFARTYLLNEGISVNSIKSEELFYALRYIEDVSTIVYCERTLANGNVSLGPEEYGALTGLSRDTQKDLADLEKRYDEQDEHLKQAGWLISKERRRDIRDHIESSYERIQKLDKVSSQNHAGKIQPKQVIYGHVRLKVMRRK